MKAARHFPVRAPLPAANPADFKLFFVMRLIAAWTAPRLSAVLKRD